MTERSVLYLPGKGKRLSHQGALSMIPRYLADDLNEHELIYFLEHVNKCETCYEELETMFIVNRAIHYLDANMEIAFDMKRDLIRDMKKKLKETEKRRVLRRLNRMFYTLAALLTSAMLLDFFGVIRLTRFLI